VHTRAFNHTGPGHQHRYAVPSFARRIALAEKAVEAGRSRPPIAHGNLNAVRDYLDVRDVVHAYRIAIQQPPGIYNVCSGTTRALSSILGELCDLSVVPMVLIPDETLYRPGMETGAAPLFHPRADPLHVAGWEPEIPWHQTLTDTLNYWRERTN
jgi:GDP-4-dehydro-6-deoxy-D-mannose reductase